MLVARNVLEKIEYFILQLRLRRMFLTHRWTRRQDTSFLVFDKLFGRTTSFDQIYVTCVQYSARVLYIGNVVEFELDALHVWIS